MRPLVHLLGAAVAPLVGGAAELDDELRQLGERYGIPAELTSYLVVEPGMRAAQFRPLRAQDTAGNATAPAAAAAGAGVAPEVRLSQAAKRASDQRDIRTLGSERQGAAGERMRVDGRAVAIEVTPRDDGLASLDGDGLPALVGHRR